MAFKVVQSSILDILLVVVQVVQSSSNGSSNGGRLGPGGLMPDPVGRKWRESPEKCRRREECAESTAVGQD